MRDKFFSELGYNVLRFWNNDIDNNFEAVLDKIRRVINAKKT
jgi:very-short-patch-repair endonuclease